MSEILENEILEIKSNQTGVSNLDKKKDKKGKKHKKDDEKSKLKAEKKRIIKEYEKELSHLQIELLKLQYYVKEKGLKLLIIFEGRDAAGKGGTIKRITEHLNPRGCTVVALPKPSDVETTQWYFQRYVKNLPAAGEIVIFDRSWYNRAVVEPVMGFCTKEQHLSFLQEVSSFERLLLRSDIIILKFFLSINKETQKERFDERRKNPLKRYKISPVDEKALALWDKYTAAIYMMFLQSESHINPWIIVDSNDKKKARINIIKKILEKIDYKDKTSASNLKIEDDIVRDVKAEMKRLEDATTYLNLYE
ncbi:MAG: polyphosphate kinase 2 [Campylobacter sp.]